MKAFANTNPRDLKQAAALLAEARGQGRAAAVASGGSDLLILIKDHLVAPDVVVNLKAVSGLDRVFSQPDAITIGGQMTLDAVGADPIVRGRCAVLAEAAESVGTPQIRNVGTLAGNLCQRPWCWYFRNGFPCFKNGGNTCFAPGGENQFHAIFGGGPSHIVHPSDTAPALVALDAAFRIVGAAGERIVPAGEFFALPRVDPKRETVLAPDEVLADVRVPLPGRGARSTYHKILDREAWTHAVVSAAVVLDMAGATCRRARIVLGGVAPVPWRLPEVEQMLAGKRITQQVAADAGERSVAGARPLAKNGYKVPLVKAVVRRTLLELANRT